MPGTVNRRWTGWLEQAGRRSPVIALGLALVAYASQLWAQKWISDDGYIYLAYVRNLFDHGELAFNLGERVDAATGFIWLLGLVAGKAVLFFLDLRQVTFVLSWACSLLAFWLLSRRVLAGERRFLLAIAAIFFARFVVSFSTSGLETPLILLLSVMIYDCGRTRFRSARMAIMLGAAPFVRPELGILLLLYWCFLLRPVDRRNLAISAGVLITLALARWIVFGDILPNTAFVKLLSPTFGQGRWYLLEFLASYWHFDVFFIAFAVIAGWLVHGLIRRRRLPEPAREHHVFAIVSTALLLAYVYASGGDFMHGRFLVTPFVLVILLVTDLGPRLVAFRPARLGPAAAAVASVAVCLAIGIAAHAAIPYSHRQTDHSFKKIDDEQKSYELGNPRLGSWSEPNPHSWAEDGRRLNRLAARVGRPVGVSFGGIGQLGYYRDADRVYLLDHLSLANVAGSMLEIQGYFRRVGHNVMVPAPLLYLEPRVTLVKPPDARLAKLLRFDFEGHDLWLAALRDVDAYVAAGLLPADVWARIDARIAAVLDADWIDRNLVFYLRHRYPDDRPLFPRIRQAYDGFAADGARSWITWYEDQRSLIDAADAIQRGERAGFPARYRLYLEAGTLKPIDTTYQVWSWAVRGGRRCELDLTRAPTSADPGVEVHWEPWPQGPALVLENPGPRRAWARLDLQSALRDQCGEGLEDVVLDWVVRDVTGAPASYFFTPPVEEKRRFYLPGPQLRIPLAAGSKPLGLAFPLQPGQRYVLSLEAEAFASSP